MTEQSLNKRYISIKWQAFSLTSLVLAIIFASFLMFISESTQRQFEIGRGHVYDQNRQQLDSLIESAAERLIQLANTSVLTPDIVRAISEERQALLAPQVDELAWTLQVDGGVEFISTYNRYGKLLSASGVPATKSLVIDILNTESAQWNIRCDARCYVEGGTPVLGDGKIIGAVVLSEPLSNVMLRFQHISNINTGLLTASNLAEEQNKFIPSWDKRLVALTNPQDSQEIIDSASVLYSLQELEDGIRLVDINDEVFELRSLPIKENQVVVISNVSHDILNMERSREESIRISVVSLVLAELILLILLWRPMTRLKTTASTLPLLAERRFKEVRLSLQGLSKQQLFNDETDILNASTIKLTGELEDLQEQLETRANLLESRSRELEKERDFVNQLLDTVHAIILIQDENGSIKLANSFAVKLSGYSNKQLQGLRYVSLLEQNPETEFLENRIRDVIDGTLGEYQHEATLKTHDGSRLHLAWRHAVLFNHETEQRQVLSVAVDISARVKAEGEMIWLANHDTLSGLLNRHRFEEELQRCFADFAREPFNVALAFLDLDEFKQVNDFYGHQKGDQLIQAVSEVLMKTSRSTDVVARIGGDEFAIIIRHFNEGEISAFAERLVASISGIAIDSGVGDGAPIACSVSIGFSTLDQSVKDVETFLSNADKAMYKAKRQGKNQYAFFSSKD